MESLTSESNVFQSLPKIEMFGLVSQKLKQAFLIDSDVELFM